MSLQAHVTYQVPEVTAAVAQAIFPAGNLVMRMCDELGMLVRDADFADLFPPQGQPAEAPAELSVCVKPTETTVTRVPGASFKKGY